MKEKTTAPAAERKFRGLAAAPGIAFGQVRKLEVDTLENSQPENTSIAADQVAAEQARFTTALDRTREELLSLQTRLAGELKSSKDAAIFDAHLMIVDDRMVYDEVIMMISDRLKSAEYSFYTVIERYAAAIAAMPDPYIQERAVDIRDVGFRVLRNMSRSTPVAAVEHEGEGHIILAEDLTPSDTASLDRATVLGFATATGSKTSHTAVLARSMQLPALVGLGHDALNAIHNGDEIILDGYTGVCIINPDPATTALMRRKQEEMGRFFNALAQESKLRPETLDGFLVQLSSNIETVEEVEEVKKFGSCGVGLFRSEFLYLTRETPPTEDEEFDIYRTLLSELGDDPLIVRTLDIGGDKLDSELRRYSEDNPFLGLRGIRLSLHERRDILRSQLRALLRAGVYGNLRVMLPMITCIEEIEEVQAMIEELKNELKLERKRYVEHLELGAMIETPAAALQVDQLAHRVDFFSIGTNDLIQYTMAIDRGNERVAYLYQPSHPVILSLVHSCAMAARRHNIYVSVCGQAAADPRLALLFAGLGVHELSMVPASLGPVRRVLRQVTMYEAEQAGQAALACATSAEALAIATRVLEKAAPEVLCMFEDAEKQS